ASRPRWRRVRRRRNRVPYGFDRLLDRLEDRQGAGGKDPGSDPGNHVGSNPRPAFGIPFGTAAMYRTPARAATENSPFFEALRAAGAILPQLLHDVDHRERDRTRGHREEQGDREPVQVREAGARSGGARRGGGEVDRRHRRRHDEVADDTARDQGEREPRREAAPTQRAPEGREGEAEHDPREVKRAQHPADQTGGDRGLGAARERGRHDEAAGQQQRADPAAEREPQRDAKRGADAVGGEVGHGARSWAIGRARTRRGGDTWSRRSRRRCGAGWPTGSSTT